MGDIEGYKTKKKFIEIRSLDLKLNHVSAFRKHTINIDGIQKSLHSVNTEGMHLTLSSNLGTELRGVFKEGVLLCVCIYKELTV